MKLDLTLVSAKWYLEIGLYLPYKSRATLLFNALNWILKIELARVSLAPKSKKVTHFCEERHTMIYTQCEHHQEITNYTLRSRDYKQVYRHRATILA